MVPIMSTSILGCDAHKRYSVFVELFENGQFGNPVRVEHEREAFRRYLNSLPEHSGIAIESTGHWYWLVDEMEHAGHRPHLAEPLESKKRMGKTHKTDALDAKGLAILLRNGTLPEVWVPPSEIRDQRELLRTRMAIRDLRTMLKHRIHSALDRYGVVCAGVSDLFGVEGHLLLREAATRLPRYTAEMVLVQLDSFDALGERLAAIEARIEEVIAPDPAVKRLQTMPGVGKVLAPVIALEVGDVRRFLSAERLASYCGLAPRVFSSGGHTRMGGTSRCVNLYLKWAFVEAANCAVRLRGSRYRHVRELYQRLQPGKGHGRAVVAVARHLAEAAYWMLVKGQDYRAPQQARSAAAVTGEQARQSPPSSTNGSARDTSGTRRLPSAVLKATVFSDAS
jgi:transposase